MRLHNEVAVITGAGSGLGKAIALEYARQGAIVIAVDRNASGAEAVAAEIAGQGGRSTAVAADISLLEDVRELFGKVKEQHGKLDILVNNAGVTGRSLGDGPVAECTEEAWDLIMGINMRGTFLCCKYGVQMMLSERKGSIVNMSSVLGLAGCQDFFKSHAYSTTKAGIIGLTRSIAAYYAKFGIRANALAPGLIDTNATVKVKQDPETMAFAQRMQPLGEGLGTAVDVAQAAVYLASKEASFVTGQVLAVDGGWSAQ